MKTGRPFYQLPSPRTVSRDVKLVFAKTRERVARMLQKYEGSLSFGTDAWTSPNHRAYVAVTVHLEIDGRPLAMLLDVVEVAKSHTGANLAVAFARILKDFGIENKVLSITCDNASANDAMIEELGDSLDRFAGQASRTRCFAHIINLVVKTLMRQFDAPKGKVNEVLSEAEKELQELAEGIDEEETEMVQDEEDREEGDGVTSGGGSEDEAEGWIDERYGMTESEKERLENSVRPMKLLLTKVSKYCDLMGSCTLLT